MRARSRQRHAPLSPARRKLRPRGPHLSPRNRPHAGPGARAAALLAAGPGAMPPGGRPTRAAAHGWVPAGPGEPRWPCRLPAQEEVERLWLHVGRSTRNLEAGCTGAPGELEARTRAPARSRSPDAAGKKRALKDPFAPGRGHAEPAGRGTPGAGPRSQAEAGFQAAPRSVRVATREATRPAPGPARD